MAKSAPQAAPRRNPADPIVARASNEYRLKRLAIVVMLLSFGGWFGYDGLIKWPNENQRIDDIDKEIQTARKANALIEYELPNGTRGSARLDDFIYQRPPTDEIFKRIEEYTGTGETSSEAAKV